MTRRQLALTFILIVDVAYIACGAAVAIAPDHILGPGGKAILPAGYEGYSGAVWSTLAPTSAGYMAVLYRLYGTYCVLFGFFTTAIALTAFRRGERWAWWTLLIGNTVGLIAAMTYDKFVNAIGPFEVTEYLGLLMIWAAFAITKPTLNVRPLMKQSTAALVILAAAIFATPALAQNPKLHVNPRWKQCSIQLDPALTQRAWRQFTQEAGQVVYFRPLADAQPMGRGKFEVSLMQWQTNVDDNSSAWNDTFVHPDSTHWLYEGGGLQFPGFAARVGVASRTDVGVYATKNFEANYGAWSVQLQQNLVRHGPRDLDVAIRASYTSLFGPDDVDLNVMGADIITSWKGWTYSRVAVVPYATASTYLSRSHENSSVVSLSDESAFGVMGTVGAALQFSVLRVSAEAGMSRVPSIAMKVGFGR